MPDVIRIIIINSKAIYWKHYNYVVTSIWLRGLLTWPITANGHVVVARNDAAANAVAANDGVACNDAVAANDGVAARNGIPVANAAARNDAWTGGSKLWINEYREINDVSAAESRGSRKDWGKSKEGKTRNWKWQRQKRAQWLKDPLEMSWMFLLLPLLYWDHSCHCCSCEWQWSFKW